MGTQIFFIMSLEIKLRNAVLSAPWQDSWQIVKSFDIWQGLYRRSSRNKELSDLMDCMTWSGGLTDYIRQLTNVRRKESASAFGGCTKTILNNMDDVISDCITQYDEIREAYPQFRQKIEDCVGQQLANLHQGYKFEWKDAYR